MDSSPSQNQNGASSQEQERSLAPSPISLPKGGGAIRGIGEKFSVNPVTGTSGISVPIYTSAGRNDFQPSLSLSYDSGSGNSEYGLGWSLSVPSITRKTSKGLPKYCDGIEEDTFILTGAEDLVPLGEPFPFEGSLIQRYRPRIEGLFSRIERIQNLDSGEIHWRSHSKDNITSIYGRSDRLDSRIADPEHPKRIFEWRLEASYDDLGNLIVYEYKPDDFENVNRGAASERNRFNLNLQPSNTYLKRIKYGNLTPYRQGDRTLSRDYIDQIDADDWVFQLVFDYGEHDPDKPTPEEGDFWDSRLDPFSNYRSGFEVRTQRLCQRSLMFHRMDESGEIDGAETWHLVRSTDFGYAPNPVATYLTSVTQTGYVQDQSTGNLVSRSYPPLEFNYDRPNPQNKIQTIDPVSLQNLPIGLDGNSYQWIDLDSEGIAGILSEQANGWFYKRNLGPEIPNERLIQEDKLGTVQFARTELLEKIPSISNLKSSQQRLLDLAGDGTQDLVSFGALSGYYQREKSGQWKNFQSFESSPTVNWNDPNLKFIDLNGDGHADILISENEVFVWFPSRARDGYGPAQRVQKLQDEKRGATLVFADPRQSVFLADMSGDGLVDIVRIRNGEICYWPNLGYAHFGAKVTMDHAPMFEHPEVFDQTRVRLSDIDGSGTTDIVYLGSQSVSLWFNQSGNGWSEPTYLKGLPIADNLATVNVIDLLGNGTACIVWSTRSPGYSQPKMYYIDLMGGQKPHLMRSLINNLGAETHLHYLPSTYFYLQDKAAGKPWITRLSFPVQVVDRVITKDRISGNQFVTRYRYRHGYFDGEEREFRGFGYVEQIDTEVFEFFEDGEVTNVKEEGLYVPPVVTKTWFHTGFYRDREHISQLFSEEYYQEDIDAVLLPDTILPEGLTGEEEREACRALKGQVLRQEVYASDGRAKSKHPYTVTESNYTIKLLQPKQDGSYGVFFTHPRESLSYQYERNPADPRVAHQLTLQVDDFGNVTKSVTIAYPRRSAALPTETELRRVQRKTLATYTEADFINQTDNRLFYRVGVPSQTKQYEITGLGSSSGKPLSFAEVEEALVTANSNEIPYEETPGRRIQRRLIESDRTLYYDRNQTGVLRLGQVAAPMLPFESYRQAFTAGLLNEVFSTKIDATEMATLLANEGQYRDLDGDGNWWIPSGQQVFDSPENFYLPIEFHDPFIGDGDKPYKTIYDSLKLLTVETVDPLGSQVQVRNSYRVLQPYEMTDLNGNRSQVAFDALGMVVGTAVMGKEGEGDSLDGFITDLDTATIQDHLANPLTDAEEILSKATTRLVYDLDAYRRSQQAGMDAQPVVVYTLARETHASDLGQDETSRIQHSFLYSDGFGRELQTKVQAEEGPFDLNDPNSPVVNPRWVGTGRTVFNNKGDPVKQYEPFFSDTHRYEAEEEIVEQGVTPILFYDPLQRTVATLLPNHTYEKVVFDAWQQVTWDVNDTLAEDNPKADEDVGGFFAGLETDNYFPSWSDLRTKPEHKEEAKRRWPDEEQRNAEAKAAEKAIKHANTPTQIHFDSLGREVLTIADNGKKENATNDEQHQLFQTFVKLDIEGNQRSVTDALGRLVMTYDYDMLGNVIRQRSMEAGDRYMLNNVAGNPIRKWDSREHQLRTLYDRLQRPTHIYMQPAVDTEQLVERLVYGEELANINDDQRSRMRGLNMLGQLHFHYEQAGVVTSERFDFKGNLLESSRRLAREYKQVVDWSRLDQASDVLRIEERAESSLEAEIFTSRTLYDALNRPVMMLSPSNETTLPNVIQPRYNEANLLEQVDVWFRQLTVPGDILDPATADLAAVVNIDYNEKGQRTRIEYSNGAITTYSYDRETFRLTQLQTIRTNPSTQQQEKIQDYQYTYDPVGNITKIRNEAEDDIYFRNKRVEPDAIYTYDALYRLTEAIGREHLGQTGRQVSQVTHDDSLRTNLPHPNEQDAMGVYEEKYQYDPVGNIMQFLHSVNRAGSWQRIYAYEEASLLEAEQVKSNRLSATSLPGDVPEQPSGRYEYDAHGNMVRMPHLPLMEWDYRDQLRATSRQVRNGGTPEITYYVYDASGERVRKVTERQAATGEVASRRKERIYLGGFEIYREFDGSGDFVNLERETLHVMDDQQRVAHSDIRTVGNDGSSSQMIRFQLGNHLDSACLELDVQSRIISYEEFHPFGSSAYQSTRSKTELSIKRFRYTGKERDSENNLDYFGARYYASWIGRWLSYDPAELDDELSLYIYSKNNPIRFWDPDGEAVETAWDVLSLGIGVVSLTQNIREGNVLDAAIDAVGVVADAAAAATPFIPGGAGAAIKAARAGDEVIGVVQTAKKMDKASDTKQVDRLSKSAAKTSKQAKNTKEPLKKDISNSSAQTTIETNKKNTNSNTPTSSSSDSASSNLNNKDRVLSGTPGKVTGGSSTKLKKNLNETIGLKRSQKTSGYEAQHIIPSQLKENAVLKKVGIDLDDASNGIFLFNNKAKPEGIVSARPRHRGSHPEYNKAVNEALNQLDINMPIHDLQKEVFNLQNRLRDLTKSGLPIRNKDGGSKDLWLKWINK